MQEFISLNNLSDNPGANQEGDLTHQAFVGTSCKSHDQVHVAHCMFTVMNMMRDCHCDK